MPGFDQTGPNGKGPLTGRRMGRCRAHPTKQNNQSDTGKSYQNNNPSEIISEEEWRFGWKKSFGGRGRGRGRGLGRQNRFRGGN